MFILFIIIYLITNFLALKYNLHIFQLNYYMPDTQIKWTLKNWKKFSIIFIINIIPIIGMFFSDRMGTILAIIMLCLIILLVIEKDVKKKIVFTKRIIRLLVTNYIVLIVLAILLKDNNYLFKNVLLGINAILPIYMIFLNYINIPINNLINKHYINDAKKILKNMPNLKIIAITGSYGKTSTKNYLERILSSKYNVLSTPGNYNTPLGITKTIRENLKPTHEIFICEVGIDRVGGMEKIIDLIQPDYCMITAIGSQHLETFKTQENIIKSKLKLIEGLKPNGIAFLNFDNEYIRESKIQKDFIGYGINKNVNNKLKIKNVTYSYKGIEFEIEEDGETYTFNSKLLGEHNLINLFGAITVARTLDIPMKEIINSVKYIKSVEHRLNIIPGSEYNLIDDSYNSNPVGAANALKVLKEMDGIRVLITPGMVELGEKQYEYNYEFGRLAASCADYIMLVNEEQTKPIQDALAKEGFPKDKINIVKTFSIAIEMAKKIENGDRQKYILIENDLPDNY